MKHYNLDMGLAIACSFIMGLSLIAMLGFIGGNVNGLTIGGAIAFGISIVVLIVTGILSFRPDSTLKKKWEGYHTLPKEKISDFAAELKETREKYEADRNPKKNDADMFGKYTPRFIPDGKIYYGYLVQANNHLFKPGFASGIGLPGVVVYSPDEYYEKNPYALESVAEYMYRNKAFNILANERNYFYNKEMTDGEGRKVYITTIFIHRPYIPDGYLRSSLFPIIADISSRKKDSVATLDSKYWTDKMIVNFLSRDFSRDSSPTIDVFGV